jgi:hypothetical protein
MAGRVGMAAPPEKRTSDEEAVNLFVVSPGEEAVGLLVELPDPSGTILARAESIMAATAVLHLVGYRLVLLPPEAVVRLKKSRRRWWRR